MSTLVAPDEQQTAMAESPADRRGTEGEPMDIARLRVLRQIGQGGMATIHLALLQDPGREPRRIALKLMHSHLTAEPSLVRRFEHEVRSQEGLRHPNVVEMAGWGRDQAGRLFMAMEFVDGPALKDLVASGRRFPADVAAHVIRGMLLGLQAAHARGIVHRDVKPANVMTTRDGMVKVADFGISKAVDMTKLTSTGSVIGTPAYMSPEQALAKPLDHRSDLFSVGVTLYEMLVGGNPFQTGNPATTLSRVVHHAVRPAFDVLPQTPPLLDELLEGLLQKDPAKRLPDAAAALAVLDRCIAEDELCATQDAFAAFIQDPETVTRKLDAMRARRHFERGCRFYGQGRGNAEAAVWEFFVATLLDPSDEQPRNWLEQVSRERGYALHRKPNARIDELEAQLKDAPDNLPVVLQLAKLHKAQGNFLQVIYYYKRAKSLRPPDNYTRNQIETLVSAQAASLLEGASAFETRDHVPVRLRAQAPAAPAPQRADGWGDFLAGIASTWWAKAGAAAAGLAGCVLLLGALVDHASNASQRQTSPIDSPMAEPGVDRQIMMLERGRTLAESGKHSEAEAVWREFLAEHPKSGLRSEALFRLGESLERQGRRPEALEAHGENAADHLDEWALKSRANRADIFSADGDLAAARREYESLAKVAEGEARLRAQLSAAQLAMTEGRSDLARQQLETLAPEAEGTSLHDDVRLSLADACAREGDAPRARSLYAEVRERADHRGDAFRRASEGLEALAASEAPAAGAEAPATPVEPDATASEDAQAPAPAPSEAPAPPDQATAAAAAADAASAPSTGLLTGLGNRQEAPNPP